MFEATLNLPRTCPKSPQPNHFPCPIIPTSVRLPQLPISGQQAGTEEHPDSEHKQRQGHRYNPEYPEARGNTEGLASGAGRAGVNVEVEELRTEY